MVEIQQNVVQNQTAVMIEIGTSLLNQTAAQTRKLTDVEAQVSDRQNPLVQQPADHVPVVWLCSGIEERSRHWLWRKVVASELRN